jgi:hypothetical protein
MRIPGLGGEVMQRASALPVILAGSEIFTALQPGAIDATEWVGPTMTWLSACIRPLDTEDPLVARIYASSLPRSSPG